MASAIRLTVAGLFACALVGAGVTTRDLPVAAQARPNNIILFVPDGLRASIVDAEKAPEMTAIKTQGVSFENSHSIFPTFTTANAASFATGHAPGDTGDFSNYIYTGFKVPSAAMTVTPFLESDPVLMDVTEHFNGNYLNEETIMSAARRAGYSTASVGKLGPVAIFDVTDKTGNGTIEIDDSTGRLDAAGKKINWPLPDDVVAQLKANGEDVAPTRGANGQAGNMDTPGTTVPNIDQQNYFVNAATKTVLPMLKAKGKPFVMVFWSRDPDGTQHNQGDSLGKLSPGINGPTSFAAIKNADNDLKALRDTVRALGLESTTDVIVAADHGFSTISKGSKTSSTIGYDLTGVPAGQLPPGFLALDLGHALGLPVSDPDNGDAVIHPDFDKRSSSKGNGLIGFNSQAPDVVVAANGGSDLVYLPQDNAREMAPKVVAALLAQDYVSGLFVDDRLGKFPGTLPLSAINLMGKAVTPTPSIVVNFRSFDTGCSLPERCAAEVADFTLQQGQGMHGSFSRADTHNFMAAIGPDFKTGFVDPAPVSNADIGQTIIKLMNLQPHTVGTLLGRPTTEAFKGGSIPMFRRDTLTSAPANGLATTLKLQIVGTVRYLDVGGFAGRTVGL